MKRALIKAVTCAIVPPFVMKRRPTKKVAILVPMSNRPRLTADEEISMRQLRHYFGNYDKFLIAPEGVAFDFEGFGVKRFPQRFFGSAAAHSRLLAMPSFYKQFADYEFVFFHHLDALAFSDQLPEWCATDIDYIGPPWIQCVDSPWVDRPRVGNGGFTLLRIEKALLALNSRHRRQASFYWFDLFTSNATLPWIEVLEKLERVFPFSLIVGPLLREWRETEDPIGNNRNNDIFWSDTAVRYLPDFKVASLEEGLRFAFEVSPKTCLKMNHGKMPFGCHAWTRYDRKFWEPHIVPENSNGFMVSA